MTRRKDGGDTYSVRVTLPADMPLPPGQTRRPTLAVGRDTEGCTPEDAAQDRLRILAEIATYGWPLPHMNGSKPHELTVFACGQAWIERTAEWSDRTREDRAWRLGHMRAFWSTITPSQTTVLLVKQFRANLINESKRRQHAIDARAAERRRGKPSNGRLPKPLSNGSINKIMATLAEILKDAKKSYSWGPGAPVVRNAHKPLKVKKPDRNWLEGDEVRLFRRAAKHIDLWPKASSELPFLETVRLRDNDKLPWKEIAARTGVPASTAHYRYQRAKSEPAIGPTEAMAIMLIAGGMRATECGDMTLGDLAVLERHFIVPGTKTASAPRTTDMTDAVYKSMKEYVDSRRHEDRSAPAFPNSNGEQRDRHSVEWFVERVATRAQLLAERDETTFPTGLRPHDLRRTCVAQLLVHGYDLGFVKDHIGNQNDRLVLEVYNNLQKRKDRSEQARALDKTLFDDPDDDV